MFWNDREFRIFVKYVSDSYGRTEENVSAFVVSEYDRLVEHSKERKTEKLKKQCLTEALANCRSWLAEDRELLTVERLESYCLAKLYFTAIVKKAD